MAGAARAVAMSEMEAKSAAFIVESVEQSVDSDALRKIVVAEEQQEARERLWVGRERVREGRRRERTQHRGNECVNGGLLLFS